MELPSDKLVMEKLGQNGYHLKSRAVGSEVRGLYYLGNKSQTRFLNMKILQLRK